MSVRTRKTPAHIRDHIGDDQWCIALEGFVPMGHRMVSRGDRFRLSSPLVRKYRTFFAVVVPVDTVLVEIER